MTCHFNGPKTFNGDVPSTSTDFWQYSEMECSSPQTELIENSTTGTSFYIKKTISYGDFIIITFLTIFLVFSITKFLINFIIPKRMNFKR